MKRLILVLALCALTVTSPATAYFAELVDLGTPAGEANGLIMDWGPVQPTTSGGNWGGISTDINSMDNLCRTVWSTGNANWASIEFLVCIYAVEIRHLDGIADESFDVYVDGVYWGSYTDVGSTETWKFTVFSGTPGNTLKIVATGQQWSGFGTYGQLGIDRVFAIVGCGPIRLTAPNGGEVLAAGNTYTITWFTDSPISNVLIEYSTNNGLSWTAVDPPNIGNSESYNWLVPAVNSNQCRVRVSDANNPSDRATSRVFTIITYVVENLSQFKSDGQTEIPIGGCVDEPTVVFKADVNAPDGDRVKLQIELRRLDEYEGKFLNEFTQESDFVVSGSQAIATAYGLVNGNYHWQARTVDENGLASAWVSFGNNSISDVDFKVPKYPFFSQRNPDWKDDHIIDRDGNVCGTIGKEGANPKGCAMTCTAMLVKYYGKDTDPGSLNACLIKKKGYEVGGSLNWYKPAECSEKKMQYEQLLSWNGKDNWQGLNDQLQKGYAVIVKVDSNGNTEDVNQHWVLVTSFEGGDVNDPNRYKINDPWDTNFDPNKSLSYYRREKYHDTFFALRVYHEQPDIQLLGKSPIDFIVTDPNGIVITKELQVVAGMSYMEYDMEGNGQLNDIVSIPQRKIGDYLIQIVPEPNVLLTDTYSIQATIEGQTMVLAEDVQIQDIPAEPYKFESRLNRSDFDNDGDVELTDLSTFCLHWFEQDCNYPDWCERTDLNYNGFVDFIDFAIFTENWLWEKIVADINIDGDVDFTDYAVLANQWMAGNCAESARCDGADLNKSGSVDLFDLAEFAELWLEGL